MGFGARLREARESIGLSQADLARAARVDAPTLNAIEQRDSERSIYRDALLAALPPNLVNVEYVRSGQGDLKAPAVHEPSQPYPASGQTLTPIVAWEHADDLPPGEYVFIPRLAITLSAGNGHDQIEFEFVKSQPQAFRADWVRAQRLRPAKLASMTAKGDSMEDRIHDGDALVIDTSQTDVIDGKPYALWYEGGERVKRLFRIPGGGLRISSDNRKYPEIVLAASDLEHVRIIGRVVHVAGSGGL